MTGLLRRDLESLNYSTLCDNNTAKIFSLRLAEGALTREENPLSHFSTFITPINRKAKQILLVHHKKSGLWIPPGGHIEPGETLLETIKREAKEELNPLVELNVPFQPTLVTIIDINNSQKCKRHYDFWFVIECNESDLNPDPAEFHQTEWVPFDKIADYVTNPTVLESLQKLLS